MEKMRMESVDMTAQNIEKIGTLFPNCITEMLDEERSTPEKKVYKKAINFEILKQMLSGDVIEGNEAYEFTWVGKKAAIVEANRPIRKTLRPCKEESVNWDTTENLYIEGDNLEVLKLLQESYLGAVKMIYIDPPYNTGNDFIYRDNFKQSAGDYEEGLGIYDEDGNRMFKNSVSNGRFHSDWCSMIYSRLLLARNLLADDGAIFISIDDNEVDNLRKCGDELFGESNFVAQLCVKGSGGRQDSKHYAVIHQYVLCYAKNIGKFVAGVDVKEEEKYPYFDEEKQLHYKTQLLRKWGDKSKREDRPNLYYPIIDPDGNEHYPMLTETTEGRWRWGKETMSEGIKNGLVMFSKNNGKWVAYEKIFEGKSNTKKYTSWVDAAGSSANNAIADIFGDKIFDYPKPVELIKLLINMANVNDGDFVLDFFSGSATTAHAAMELNRDNENNRKFIMVQLPEETDEKSDAYRAGYKNICEIGKERIRRVGKKIKEENPLTTHNLDTGFRVLKLDDSNMTDVYYSADEYSQEMLPTLESNVKADRTDLDLLFGCLLEWGLPLSLPYTSEQIEGCTVHTYNDGDLIACFDENIPGSVIKTIAKRQPLRAVFRDSSFANSPSKINVGEIFKLFAPDTRVKVI